MAQVKAFEVPKDDLFGFDYSFVSLLPISALLYEKIVDEVIKRYNKELKKIRIKTVIESSLANGVTFVTKGRSLEFVVHVESISDKGTVIFSLVTNRLYGETQKLNTVLSLVSEKNKINPEFIFVRNGHFSSFVFVDIFFDGSFYFFKEEIAEG